MKDVAKVERDAVKFGETTIEYSIRRSRRRKRTIEIRVNPVDGVLVAAPLRASLKELRQVILKRAGWIVQKASETVALPPRRELVSGESIPYLGEEVPLSVASDGVRRVRLVFDLLGFHVVVPGHLVGEERKISSEGFALAFRPEVALRPESALTSAERLLCPLLASAYRRYRTMASEQNLEAGEQAVA